jgi:uncharacterized membrane protein YhaH (DUF805 family)
MNDNHQVEWWWYLLTALIPIVGLVRGIIAAAKDRIGPALALWATAASMTYVWTILIFILVYAASSGDNSGYNY